MKHNKFALAATSGLVGLSVLAGSVAYAAGNSNAKSADELQQFLGANPKVASVVVDVESKTGGKVTGAEFDDEKVGNGVVEFEVLMADGSEQDVLFTLADGSMVVNPDDENGNDDGDDDGNDRDDDDGETNDDGNGGDGETIDDK